MSPAASTERPTVVLLHGLSGSARWWRYTTTALEADHRVIALDLRGFGERRRAGRFSLEGAAEDVVEQMGRVGAARGSLIGHSLGGLVAAAIAADQPSHVDRLVLVSAPIVPFPWGLGRHALNVASGTRTVEQRFLPVLAADALRAGPINLLSATRQLLRADLTDRWSRIAAPTLVVSGSLDGLVPPSLGRLGAGLIPSGRHVEMADAGHIPMWERPDEFNALVRSFLDHGP